MAEYVTPLGDLTLGQAWWQKIFPERYLHGARESGIIHGERACLIDALSSMGVADAGPSHQAAELKIVPPRALERWMALHR